MRIVRTCEAEIRGLSKAYRFLLICDLHNEKWDDLLPLCNDAQALLVPGDFTNRYHGSYRQGIDFLSAAAKILPVFVSPGNHEYHLRSEWDQITSLLSGSGVHWLANNYEIFEEWVIGGWYKPDFKPNTNISSFPKLPDPEKMIDNFVLEPRPKLLLCHRPQSYMMYLKDKSIDLTLSGHAHGGQIRIMDRGLYAPGEGILPQYTKGFYNNGKLFVTTGIGNPIGLPRFGNPCEAVYLNLKPME